MFKRKSKTANEENTTTAAEPKRRNWLPIMIAANIVLVIGIAVFAGSAVVIHQSDTNPEFCASCHIMQPNVTSYLTSNNLDNVHAEAGVMCKDCHSDYQIPQEIEGAVNFLTGSYIVDENGELPQRTFGDQICTQCHISREYMERATDFLFYNPHGTLMGVFECSTCHISHGEQRDYCSECHTNGGQRMIGDDTPREEVLGKPVSHYSGMFGQ